MNEKLAKKLKKILAKAGLEEDKIGEIVDEVEEELAEEAVPEEGNPEENPVPPSEEEGAPAPEEAPVPVEEEPAPAPEEAPVPEEVPPTDGSIDAALNELAAQEGAAAPQAEVPPAPVEAPLPAVDPAEFGKLVSDLGEANKTIEALKARVDSLTEALKGAGVITSESRVGDETPRITPNANANQEDAFDDILDVINGK